MSPLQCFFLTYRVFIGHLIDQMVIQNTCVLTGNIEAKPKKDTFPMTDSQHEKLDQLNYFPLQALYYCRNQFWFLSVLSVQTNCIIVRDHSDAELSKIIMTRKQQKSLWSRIVIHFVYTSDIALSGMVLTRIVRHHSDLINNYQEHCQTE